MLSGYVIKVTNLNKSYSGNHVVRDVCMNIKSGEIYGFVGPNGAGKSTILKMLLNLVQPDSGEIHILDWRVSDDNCEFRKKIGSIIENPYFYEKLSARKNLELHGKYMGYNNLERINEVLKIVSLENDSEKTVNQYSLGMKQRLAIARAILTEPKILILDEPINALDPEGIWEMRNLFRKLSKEENISIIISSHILSEVEMIADTVGIIKKGQLLEEISINDIDNCQKEFIEIDVDNVKKTMKLFDNLIKYQLLDSGTIRILDKAITEIEISKLIVQNQIGLISLSRKKSSLEDYFFHTIAEK